MKTHFHLPCSRTNCFFLAGPNWGHGLYYSNGWLLADCQPIMWFVVRVQIGCLVTLAFWGPSQSKHDNGTCEMQCRHGFLSKVVHSWVFTWKKLPGSHWDSWCWWFHAMQAICAGNRSISPATGCAFQLQFLSSNWFQITSKLPFLWYPIQKYSRRASSANHILWTNLL